MPQPPIAPGSTGYADPFSGFTTKETTPFSEDVPYLTSQQGYVLRCLCPVGTVSNPGGGPNIDTIPPGWVFNSQDNNGSSDAPPLEVTVPANAAPGIYRYYNQVAGGVRVYHYYQFIVGTITVTSVTNPGCTYGNIESVFITTIRELSVNLTSTSTGFAGEWAIGKNTTNDVATSPANGDGWNVLAGTNNSVVITYPANTPASGPYTVLYKNGTAIFTGTFYIRNKPFPGLELPLFDGRGAGNNKPPVTVPPTTLAGYSPTDVFGDNLIGDTTTSLNGGADATATGTIIDAVAISDTAFPVNKIQLTGGCFGENRGAGADLAGGSFPAKISVYKSDNGNDWTSVSSLTRQDIIGANRFENQTTQNPNGLTPSNWQLNNATITFPETSARYWLVRYYVDSSSVMYTNIIVSDVRIYNNSNLYNFVCTGITPPNIIVCSPLYIIGDSAFVPTSYHSLGNYQTPGDKPPTTTMANFNLSYKEIGPVITADIPQSDRLLIIGTALDGPTNTPIRIRNFAEAVDIFGGLNYDENTGSTEDISKRTTAYPAPPTGGSSAGNYGGNELLRAYIETTAAGAANIWMCRIGGTRASAFFGATGAVNGIKVLSNAPGRSYNDTQIVFAVSGGVSTLSVNTRRIYGGSRSWQFDASVTVDKMVSVVNSSSAQSVATLELGANVDPLRLVNTLTPSTGVVLAGGTYGTATTGETFAVNKTGLYTELTREGGTFEQLLDRIEADGVYLAGVYADDLAVTGANATTTSFAGVLSKFAYDSSAYQPTHAYIGLNTTGYNSNNPDSLSEHVESNLINITPGYSNEPRARLKYGYFRDKGFTSPVANGVGFIDYGSYISVVCAELKGSNDSLGLYQTSGVATYVGQVVALPSQIAMTKQTLKGANMGPAYTYREKHVRNLVEGVGASTRQKGRGSLVVVRNNTTNGQAEWVSDVTFAVNRDSAFADLQPQRVVQEAINRVKEVLNPFLGKAFETAAEIAMNAQIKRVLSVMVSEGKLHAAGEGVAFSFQVTADPFQVANNEMSVDLVLWPALQIKTIKISTTVRR